MFEKNLSKIFAVGAVVFVSAMVLCPTCKNESAFNPFGFLFGKKDKAVSNDKKSEKLKSGESRPLNSVNTREPTENKIENKNQNKIQNKIQNEDTSSDDNSPLENVDVLVTRNDNVKAENSNGKNLKLTKFIRRSEETYLISQKAVLTKKEREQVEEFYNNPTESRNTVQALRQIFDGKSINSEVSSVLVANLSTSLGYLEKNRRDEILDRVENVIIEDNLKNISSAERGFKGEPNQAFKELIATKGELIEAYLVYKPENLILIRDKLNGDLNRKIFDNVIQYRRQNEVRARIEIARMNR